MEEPLPPSIQKILVEQDPLRLVIRAQAEFEQYLTMAIRARFVGQKWPKELKGLGFRQRVALAIGLGLVDSLDGSAITAFADLRNEVAHGKKVDEEITTERARVVFDACREWFDEDLIPSDDQLTVATMLQLAASSVYLRVAGSVRRAEVERTYVEDAAAKARRESQEALSLEEIEELLRQENEEDGEIEMDEPEF